tara:strand:+ start:544 stop:987 length:444 start_codon:yes stop_codon:yes gene_type:complete
MKQYKSMRGVSIDLAKLMAKSEKNISVGNTQTNARGDQLGRGGRVVKSADAIAREHYNVNNPRAVVKSSIKVDNDVDASGKEEAVKKEPVKQTEDDWVEPTPTKEEPKEEVKETEPVTQEAEDDDWVEDENGDFVRKSETKKTKKKK